MHTSQGFRDLTVYKLAFKLAMEIFHETKRFPKEETYSLIDQIRRASRSVATNIGEGYRKKRYPKMFVSKMADADGEATETQVWLDFSEGCGYLPRSRPLELLAGYEEVGRMLGGMIAHPERFLGDVLLPLPPAPASCPRCLLPPAYCLPPVIRS
jgi:four helix bundle protein